MSTDDFQIPSASELGRGGSAIVYSTEVGGRLVALKRPRPDVLSRRPELRAAFEREYHTLVQLAHPNIIGVYDYGIDQDGPWYTMELLDGQPLRDMIPLPWRRVCDVLRDVASALALVHSRRLVHRDISLGNVRLAEDGSAKLIDFGTMTQIGIPADTTGTPAYMAPEAVYRQELGPWTDLFSLGALGYRLLSGRDAYPARSIEQLRDVWRSRPRAISGGGWDVPDALEQLLRELLSLNPDGRPQTAAEVYVRLGGIAGVEEGDQSEIVGAYLSRPALAGRDEAMKVIRVGLLNAARGVGAAVLIDGPAGIGRSRLLDASVLEGRLSGVAVARARPSGFDAAFELVTALVRELQTQVPSGVDMSQALVDLLGQTHEEREQLPDDRKQQLQQALANWVISAGRFKPVLLVVDDMHIADVPSAGALVRLCSVAANSRVLLLTSSRSRASGPAAQAVALFSACAQQLTLVPLTENESSTMVCSLFGQVDNVQVAAKRIFEVARGNPQATVDLAVWLVDTGPVVHKNGCWLIPDTLSGLPLPASVDEALRARLVCLSDDALQLGAGIALAGDIDFASDAYGELLGGADAGRVQDALAQLVGAAVVVANGEEYRIAQQAYRALLENRLGPERTAKVHQRLAGLCRAMDQLDWRIFHLFRSGQHARAMDLLLTRVGDGHSPATILYTLDARVAYLREAVELCRQLSRPAHDWFVLDLEMVREAGPKSSLVREEIGRLSDTFKELTGYNDWCQLSQELEPTARIGEALQIAQARYEALAERERICAPWEALRKMSGFIGTCAAAAGSNSDMDLIERLPSLQPFVPLSPALRLLSRQVEATRATVGGRPDVASDLFIQTVEELDAGLGEVLGPMGDRMRRHAIIVLGMANAGMSRSIALDYVEQLEEIAQRTKDRFCHTTALRVRHLYHMRRGNFRQAEVWRNELDMDKLVGPAAMFHPSGVFTLSWVHSTTGNIAGMRDCLTQMREYSHVAAGLRVWEQYMDAEYDRLRGAVDIALPKFSAILAEQGGRHMAWLCSAHGALLCHESLGQLEEGRKLGEDLLQSSRELQLSLARGMILRPLSLIEARLGNLDRAVALVSENIAQCMTSGMGGINLGAAYEFRARVAIYANDPDNFEIYSERCAECYHADGANPHLTARVDNLLREAREAGVINAQWQPRQLDVVRLPNHLVELRDRLLDCTTLTARAEHALKAVLSSFDGMIGHLLTLQGGRLELATRLGSGSDLQALEEHARRHVAKSTQQEAASGTEVAPDITVETASATGTASATYGPGTGHEVQSEGVDGVFPFLLRPSRAQEPSGVVLLRSDDGGCPQVDYDLLGVVADALAHGQYPDLA